MTTAYEFRASVLGSLFVGDFDPAIDYFRSACHFSGAARTRRTKRRSIIFARPRAREPNVGSWQRPPRNQLGRRACGLSAPNNLPANFFNVNSPRGVIFATPGTAFQVS